MLTDVVSDTHDDIAAIRKTVEFFNLRYADSVPRCGDIFLPFAAKNLPGLNMACPANRKNKKTKSISKQNFVK